MKSRWALSHPPAAAADRTPRLSAQTLDPRNAPTQTHRTRGTLPKTHPLQTLPRPPPTHPQHTRPKVWVSRNVEEREVVVAFRGTEQVKWQDFVSGAP